MDQQHFGGGVDASRGLAQAMWRGFRGRCPRCDRGRLFRAFLKVTDRCEACGEEFHHHRADDLPAYLVIFIVGHVVVAGFMGTETMWALSTWQHLAIWAPVTVALSLVLLQPVKGAVVGLQWAMRMHGFGDGQDVAETHPEL